MGKPFERENLYRLVHIYMCVIRRINKFDRCNSIVEYSVRLEEPRIFAERDKVSWLSTT